jgi:hypothetical protein
MSAAASPEILPIDRFRRHRFSRSAAWEPAIFLVYALALGGFAIHLYRTPIYAMDSVQYMGNALLMEDNDIGRVHARVYSELKRTLPKSALNDLLGNRPDAPADQNRSRQARAADPGPFAEFLPMFAIRPLYNQTLWLVSKTGLGLVRSGILISAAAYFGLGLLLFSWIRKYAPVAIGAAFSLLLMISPPLVSLGRETTSDALATLVAFAALYLILEKRRLLPGLMLLLASIYFRTDFVVLAGLTILACWWKGSLDIWKAAILAWLALGSVVAINHYSGDYGLKMLYYRSFMTVPVAPAEIVAQFSAHDYLKAVRSGLSVMVRSFFMPFLAFGIICVTRGRMPALFTVSLSYAIFHFAIFPNWEERFVGVFYLSMGVCAASAIRREYDER